MPNYSLGKGYIIKDYFILIHFVYDLAKEFLNTVDIELGECSGQSLSALHDFFLGVAEETMKDTGMAGLYGSTVA